MAGTVIGAFGTRVVPKPPNVYIEMAYHQVLLVVSVLTTVVSAFSVSVENLKLTRGTW